MRITFENLTYNIDVRELKISNLRYADDTTLFSTTNPQMEELISRMEKTSLEFGLRINGSKTWMVIVE